jgi:hypothetical protein
MENEMTSKLFRPLDPDAVNKELERQLEVGDSEKQTKDRPKINKGHNVFVLYPHVGSMLEPYLFRYVHYAPFHMCLRGPILPDSSEKKGLKEDKMFSKCPRCIGAWNYFSENGKPSSGPVKSSLLSNMGQVKCLLQVLDVTPFFRLDTSVNIAVPDKEKCEKYLEKFFNTLLGEDDGEGLPEDILKCAKMGAGVLAVNSEVGKSIRSMHIDKILNMDGDNPDPLMHPDKYLLTIVRGDGKSSDDGVKAYSYDVKFTIPNKMKDWQPGKRLIKYMENSAIDIDNPLGSSLEVSSIEEKNSAMAKLTKEEVLEFLQSSNHSFSPVAEGPQEEVAAKSNFSPANSSDPDAFAVDEDTLMSTRSKADMAALKGKYE